MRSEAIALTRTAEGDVLNLGGWPLLVELTNELAQRYVRAGSDDLIDLKVDNGRGIYRLEDFDRRRRTWSARLVYAEDHLGGGYP